MWPKRRKLAPTSMLRNQAPSPLRVGVALLAVALLAWMLPSCAADSPSRTPSDPHRGSESAASESAAPADSDRRSGADAGATGATAAPASRAPSHERSSPAAPDPAPSVAPQPGRWIPLSVEDLPAPVLWQAPESPTPRPLVVSAHGAGGTPEWHCDWLTNSAGQRAHVLCLRGHAMSRGADAYYYPEHHTLERLFLRGTQAATSVLAPHVAHDGPHVYVGYSQGATMGALMIVAHAERYPNLLLIEGGHSHWTEQRSREFAERGGRRVYFACGQASCKRAADRSSQHLRQAGVEVHVGYAPGAGHTPAGEVGRLAEKGLQWLLSTP